MQGLAILFGRGVIPKRKWQRQRILYAANEIAEQMQTKYKIKPTSLLVRYRGIPFSRKPPSSLISNRKDAHVGGYKANEHDSQLHLTVDVKDYGMEQNGKHLTAHVYVGAKYNISPRTTRNA